MDHEVVVVVLLSVSYVFIKIALTRIVSILQRYFTALIAPNKKTLT